MRRAPRYPATMPAAAADHPARAGELAAALLAHPSVARLDGGPFGTVASHLPGRRRVVGVRIGTDDEPVELAVVVRLGIPLPRLAEELGAVVRGLLGPVAVEVTFSDVVSAPARPVAGRHAPDPLA
jgi:hypothetical protein